MKTRTIRPAERPKLLTQRRRMKMAESAHAYVRGNTVKFYEWLESTRAAEILPDVPPVWICGDCHIGNLGPAEERIEDVTPRIPLGKRFWALSKEERTGIDCVAAEEETRKLITCLKSRKDKDAIAVLDAAYWVKGCSSLGRLRYAALIGIGEDARKEMCLIDIKESTKAAAPRSQSAPTSINNAERVVAGAKALSPFLGDRMLATHLEDRSVVLRELMPQDLKFEMERLKKSEAIAAARLFASVVGKAHGRQMDQKTRLAWAKELGRSRSKTLDAPS